ncbi:MAG: Zn-ribbon domain-containing OB-fold protein [Lautropia sp.]
MTPTFPLPTIDETTRPYWEAARRGELRLQRCRGCGSYQHFPGNLCSACGSADLEWAATSGRGVVYSFVVVHRTTIPGFTGRVPYAVAWIELDDGPTARVLSDLVETDVGKLRIGDPVEVVFDPVSPEATVPRFRTVPAASA